MKATHYETTDNEQIIHLLDEGTDETVACTLPLGPLRFGFRPDLDYLELYNGSSADIKQQIEQEDRVLMFAGTNTILNRVHALMTMLLEQADLTFEHSLSSWKGQNLYLIHYNEKLTHDVLLKDTVNLIFSAAQNATVVTKDTTLEENPQLVETFTYVSEETDEVQTFQSDLTDEKNLVEGIAGNEL